MPLRVEAEKAAQWAQSVRQAQARERARPPVYSGPSAGLCAAHAGCAAAGGL